MFLKNNLFILKKKTCSTSNNRKIQISFITLNQHETIYFFKFLNQSLKVKIMLFMISSFLKYYRILYYIKINLPKIVSAKLMMISQLFHVKNQHV